MRDFVHLFDLISLKPSLLIDGKKQASSLLGGTLGILIIVTVICSTYFFSRDVVLRLNQTVNYSRYYATNENIFINKENFFLTVSLRRSNSQDFPSPDEIYEVNALRFHNKNQAQEDGTFKVVLETTPVPMRTCTSDDFQIYEDLKEYDPTKYHCLGDEASLEMFNPLGHSGENAYLNIFIRPCQPEKAAERGITCASKDILESELQSSLAWIRLNSHYVLHDDFEIPVKRYTKNIFNNSDIRIYNRTYVNFGKLTYETDEGLMFENLNEINIFNYQDDEFKRCEVKEESKIFKQTCHQMTLSFGANGLHDKYVRKYRKLQNVLADIGGFTKGVTLIATLFNSFFSQSFYIHLLFDESFFSYFGSSDEVFSSRSINSQFIAENRTISKTESQEKDPTSCVKVGNM